MKKFAEYRISLLVLIFIILDEIRKS